MRSLHRLDLPSVRAPLTRYFHFPPIVSRASPLVHGSLVVGHFQARRPPVHRRADTAHVTEPPRTAGMGRARPLTWVGLTASTGLTMVHHFGLDRFEPVEHSNLFSISFGFILI
jgi:hypothetical protein